jgi:hypothetical protein
LRIQFHRASCKRCYHRALRNVIDESIVEVLSHCSVFVTHQFLIIAVTCVDIDNYAPFVRAYMWSISGTLKQKISSCVGLTAVGSLMLHPCAIGHHFRKLSGKLLRLHRKGDQCQKDRKVSRQATIICMRIVWAVVHIG